VAAFYQDSPRKAYSLSAPSRRSFALVAGEAGADVEGRFAMTRIAARVFALSAMLVAGPALAADVKGPPPMPRLITVSGQGESSAVPDQAELTAGVVTQGATAAEALAANSRAMTNVFDALKKAGIAEKSIQTSNFSVSPQYTPYKPDSTEPPRIVGYQVSNNVTVKVSDLKKLGPDLDALVSSGANQVSGVSFSIADTKSLMEDARAKAVKDAMAHAETYAKAAGVDLGRVMSISEGGGQAPQPVFLAMAREAPMAAPPPPMAEGEQTIEADVTMMFEIK
jgi:uncharacterized protein YggE